MIGAIHGNERAGIAIVRRLAHDTASRQGAPLGAARSQPRRRPREHARQRARRRPEPQLRLALAAATAPGTTFYAGPGPLSEPESRFGRLLISRLRPDITIWFHQSETAVDSSSGSTAIEARFARRVALPLRRLVRYPGSATTWQAHRFPKSTSFVVELPPGTLSSNAARAYARAVLALARG